MTRPAADHDTKEACDCDVCKLCDSVMAAIVDHGKAAKKKPAIWMPMEALATVAAEIIDSCPEEQRAEMIGQFIQSFANEVGAEFDSVEVVDRAPAGAVKH